jgi:hypothetical protein
MLLVTQMLFALSVAIPVGERLKLRRGQAEKVGQEVVPAGISMRPLLVVTQTFCLESTAIFPKDVGDIEPAGAEKVVEGGVLPLPPIPPPPAPQAGSDKSKIMKRRIRYSGPTLCPTRFSPERFSKGDSGIFRTLLDPRLGF